VFASDGSSTGTSRIVKPGDEGPAAAFATTTTAPAAEAPVSFDGSGSSDPDGAIVAYHWNFGDGSGAGSGQAPSHAYAVAGTYTATLTVTDSWGHRGTLEQAPTVARAPALISAIAGSPGGGPAPDSRFSASATIDGHTGAITLVVALADAGKLSWLSTFANG